MLLLSARANDAMRINALTNEMKFLSSISPFEKKLMQIIIIIVMTLAKRTDVKQQQQRQQKKVR